MKRKLDYYKALPYSRRAEGIHDDGRPYWVVWIDELPGCKTDGATIWEAMLNLDAAFDDYIKAMLEFGSRIPVPNENNRRYAVSDITRDQIPHDYFFEVLDSCDDQVATRPKSSAYIQNWVVDGHGTNVTTTPVHEIEYV
ncbi:MAG: type II toxin-antitoxin system HicB family antitoxin [Candidatus Latescibacteria bacterium]|nr:type II toxin-antitoxin system HicB family antitoxin [Candidatus Latescibacterota bacterium]